jgi:hypothetical protein
MADNGPKNMPAREQLLALLGKMAHEAEKVKAQLNSLRDRPSLGNDIEKICSGCIACGGCIYNV